MDRRDRTGFDDRCKRLALGIMKLGLLAGPFAINQRIRPAGIEPHNPVPHNLQTCPADPRSIAPAAVIADLSNRRLGFAFFVFRARRRNAAPSKSTRNPIAVPMATSFNLCHHRVRPLPRWESPAM